MAGKVPIRLWVAVMIFFSVFTSYVIRLHFNILIVPMVTNTTYGKASKPCVHIRNVRSKVPHQEVKHHWSEPLQGQLIASYNYGFFFSSALGGILAENVGPYRITVFCSLVSGILVAITSLSARINWGCVFGIRIALGVLGGLFYPSAQRLLSKWCPPDEINKFISFLMGNSIAFVVTLPTCAWIAQAFTYDVAFVTCGVWTLLFCATYAVVVSDTPGTNWWIGEKELQYIVQAQDSVVHKNLKTPYGRIFRNVPFLALSVAHFGNMWGLFFQVLMLPKYFVEVQGYTLKETGFFTAMPYLARFFGGAFFGIVGGVCQKKNVSVTAVRKFFVVFSHILPAIFTSLVVVAGCKTLLVVALLTLALLFNGAVVLTVLQNPHDLAPNFAGTVYGLMQAFATVASLIIPPVTAEFIKRHNGLREWHYMFMLSGAIYLVTGCVYLLFGSGVLQEFNEAPENDADQKGAAAPTTAAQATEISNQNSA